MDTYIDLRPPIFSLQLITFNLSVLTFYTNLLAVEVYVNGSYLLQVSPLLTISMFGNPNNS